MDGPATIVIFGASGDLTARKLIPALFENARKGRLPAGTRIVGVSRTPMTDDEFRRRLFESSCRSLGDACRPDEWNAFARGIHYIPGNVSTPDDGARLHRQLRELESGHSSGRLYYLALAPALYSAAIASLGAAGLANQDHGWSRVVFEKPFGHDLASARELNRTVLQVFDESQVFRIDHYLGKETVQNLLVLRFANTIFEPVWNRNFIEHVQITVAETVKVGSRGGYYDTAGVLRDMFQNHLLQVLTLIAMEPPGRYEANPLRDEKVKVLDAVRLPQRQELDAFSVLGQYEGYRDEPGVAADSRTPTFAAVRLYVDTWRWKGVPFYLRSGKGLADKTTEVIIQFLCPPHMVFDVPEGQTIHCNRLVITIQPDEGVHLSFQTKIPDHGMALRESILHFHYRSSYPETPIPEAYQRLLLDAIRGDASLFIRKDEIELAWRIMDPILEGWAARDTEPMPTYPVGSWGPPEADRFMEHEGRRWVNGASLHHDA